jgi:hypothetical protein
MVLIGLDNPSMKGDYWSQYDCRSVLLSAAQDENDGGAPARHRIMTIYETAAPQFDRKASNYAHVDLLNRRIPQFSKHHPNDSNQSEKQISALFDFHANQHWEKFLNKDRF